jgi:hypothetical protein
VSETVRPSALAVSPELRSGEFKYPFSDIKR